MSNERMEQVISRAREGYQRWEAEQAARPWHVKTWDRIRSECGYALYRLRNR